MNTRPPLVAILLGVAGLIPFIFSALAALSPDPVYAQQMLGALLAYGAVVLSFLGGIQWGFALKAGPIAPTPTPMNRTGEPQARSENRRLILSVVPSLIGWLALLAPLALPEWTGLLLLIAGFLGTAVVESRGARHIGEGGFLPSGYMLLRWGLTAAVVALLVTVLTLRLLGQRVLI